jgi:hypothetical protein
MAKAKIVNARADDKGNITHVQFKGNQNFTPLATAIKMGERGDIENAHVVKPKDGRKKHLRTNPDKKRNNNLDDMAGDN